MLRHCVVFSGGVARKVPPPHFTSFAGNFADYGLWFAVVWGLLMWFAIWSRQHVSPHVAVGTAIFAGVLFGLGMAAYYRYGDRKHGIPLWKDFRPEDGVI